MAAQGPPPTNTSTGIELTTLFISAVASAVAAYVVSKIWAPGTLFSAAFTPVIVALVKEGLRRPTEKVADVASTVGSAVPLGWARSGADDAALVPDPNPPEPLPDPDAPQVDPDAPHVVLPPVVAAEHAPVSVYSTRRRRLRWRLALVTGLLAFVICVLVYTVPELVSGNSLGRHGSSATTIFGGHSRHHRSRSRTSTTRTTDTTSTTSTTRTTRTTPDTRTTTTTQTPSSATPQSTTTPPSSATPAPSTATPQSSSTAVPATP